MSYRHPSLEPFYIISRSRYQCSLSPQNVFTVCAIRIRNYRFTLDFQTLKFPETLTLGGNTAYQE